MSKIGVCGNSNYVIRKELLSLLTELGCEEDDSIINETDSLYFGRNVYYIGQDNKIKCKCDNNNITEYNYIHNNSAFLFKKGMKIKIDDEIHEIISLHDNDGNLCYTLSNNKLYSLDELLYLFINSLKKLTFIKNNCEQIYKREIKETKRKYRKRKFNSFAKIDNCFNFKVRTALFNYIYEDIETIIDIIYHNQKQEKTIFYEEIIKRLNYFGYNNINIKSEKEILTIFFKRYCDYSLSSFMNQLIYNSCANAVFHTKMQNIINIFWRN